MKKIWAIALNTFREALRNYILYSVISFAVLLVAVSAFFGGVTIGDQDKVIKDFGLFALSLCGAVLTIVSGVSLLNKELKQRTVYNILSKPVARWQFVVGKFAGLSGTTSILVALMGVGLVVFTAALEGRIDWLLFQGMLFVILEVILLSAVAVFFSSLVVTTTLTALFTLAAYVIGRSLGYLQWFLTREGSPELKAVVRVCDIVLPDLSLLNAANYLVYGIGAPPALLLHAVVYVACYCTVLLILASLIFSRRELT